MGFINLILKERNGFPFRSSVLNTSGSMNLVRMFAAYWATGSRSVEFKSIVENRFTVRKCSNITFYLNVSYTSGPIHGESC